MNPKEAVFSGRPSIYRRQPGAWVLHVPAGLSPSVMGSTSRQVTVILPTFAAAVDEFERVRIWYNFSVLPLGTRLVASQLMALAGAVEVGHAE